MWNGRSDLKPLHLSPTDRTSPKEMAHPGRQQHDQSGYQELYAFSLTSGHQRWGPSLWKPLPPNCYKDKRWQAPATARKESPEIFQSGRSISFKNHINGHRPRVQWWKRAKFPVRTTYCCAFAHIDKLVTHPSPPLGNSSASLAILKTRAWMVLLDKCFIISSRADFLKHLSFLPWSSTQVSLQLLIFLQSDRLVIIRLSSKAALIDLVNVLTNLI